MPEYSPQSAGMQAKKQKEKARATLADSPRPKGKERALERCRRMAELDLCGRVLDRLPRFAHLDGRDIVAVDRADFGLEAVHLGHASVALHVVRDVRFPSVAEPHAGSLLEVVCFHVVLCSFLEAPKYSSRAGKSKWISDFS